MSWFSKVCFLSIPLSLGFSAFGQRIEFNPLGDKATVDSHLLTRGSEVSPIEIELNIPFIDVEKTRDGFDSIAVKGLVPTVKMGAPEVLTTGQVISVPEGYEAKLTVLDQNTTDVPNVWVQPAQRKFRCHTGRAETFAFNSALYQSDSVYPQQNVSLEEIGKLQSVRLMRVALNPVQMDFANRSLKVTTRLKVRVDFEKTTTSRQQTLLPKSIYKVVRLATSNGQGLGEAVRSQQSPETMLILVANEFKSAIAPLVQWKQKRGYQVEVFTATEAGSTKEGIKQFLQNYYDTHAVKPSFLITVGNKTSLPTYMESTASGSAASDLKYSQLSGGDNIPDLFYGRLVADNLTDLQTQMNRWIAYERNPEMGANWYSDGTTIASPDGSGPSDKEYAEQIQEILKANTYKNVDSFFNITDTATAANITAAAEQGRTWFAYFGHGSGTSWASTNDEFSNTQVAALKNAGRLPFIIDVACQNASWVKLPKCFGKAWVTQTTAEGQSAGAVAFYGGSVNISWHPPAVMSVGVAKSHFEKQIPTLGGSVIAGQLYLFEKMGENEETLDNLKWYNLLGDPSLNMRTTTPMDYQVKKVIARSADLVKLDLTATDSSGNGVAGLTVAVTTPQRGTVAVGTTQANGKATLSLPSVIASGSDATLTVSGYNAKTVELNLIN
jgi:hypothetical protein